LTGLIAVTQEFALYLDESGSPKPNPRDSANHFAVGGLLLKRQDEIVVQHQIYDFKQRWNITDEVPLHGNEIRSCKNRFAWLGRESTEVQSRFLQDLTDTLMQLPMIVHACVVSRQGYLDRYFNVYGEDTWEMMKSSFSILVERVGKYVAQQDGKVMVYFEKAGKKEDRLLTSYFNALRDLGTPFSAENSAKYEPLEASQFHQVLSGIEGKSKSNAILQVADLCLYPIARSKDQPDNLAFRALNQNQKLIDSFLSPAEVEQMGVKYYCFDDR
jgi:hypothetical protein